MATHGGEAHDRGRPTREPSLDRWRRHYERDRRAFERAHGRPAATHYELARWLTNAP